MPRRKLDDAESRLLAAGLSLFARDGTERVNTNAIARRAAVGVGTFYAHFPDKYALLREVQMRTLAGIRATRAQSLRGTTLVSEQVERSIAAVVAFAARHPEAYRVTFGRERSGAARHGPVVTESSRPTADGLRQLQRAGRVHADLDVELAARAYLSMEAGTLLWWLEDRGRCREADLVATLVRLHPALAARSPSSQAQGS